MNKQQVVANETIKYTVNYMINKMQAAGYTEAQVAAYLTSDKGASEIFRLAQQFANSIAE